MGELLVPGGATLVGRRSVRGGASDLLFPTAAARVDALAALVTHRRAREREGGARRAHRDASPGSSTPERLRLQTGAAPRALRRPRRAPAAKWAFDPLPPGVFVSRGGSPAPDLWPAQTGRDEGPAAG